MKNFNEDTGEILRPHEYEISKEPEYVPIRKRPPANLKTRVITAAVFAFIMAAFLIPAYWLPWISLILFALIAMIGGSEFSTAMRMAGYSHEPWIVSLFTLFSVFTPFISIGFGKKEYVIWSSAWPGMAMLMPVLLVGLMVTLALIVPIIRRGIQALSGAMVSAFGIIYISFPLVCAVVILYTLPSGWFWLLTAIVTPWISDTTAYFTGSLIGSHKIFPRISPNKTWEGFIGGLLGPVIAMMIWLPLVLAPQSEQVVALPTGLLLIFAVLFGVMLGLFSQVGDLFASALKRWARVKDFGNILPGHGGVLDRFDSAFFTLPLMLSLGLLYFGV
ncbi:MAG TPA: phosphatidate cytidylyltransferase [Clostridiaceae bacterium]|nr:phosphatidate cytidylyltransferase [Clostridiaceae bacterium]